MDPKSEIKLIRQLLADYYDGASTPAQTEELSRLLASTPSLPADLQMERDIFTAIEGIASDNVQMPPELPHRIENAINAEHKKHHRHILWIRATSVAAAIAIICSVGLHIFNPHSTSAPTVGVPDVMLSQNIHTDRTPIASIETTPSHAASEMIPAKRTKTARRTKRRQPPAYGNESKVILVTDTVEATYYAEQSLQLLAMNMTHAETACQHTAQKISELNTTLNEILK